MTMLRRLAPFADTRPRLCLVLLCLALWLPGFFVLPPTDRDESRFAQATKQMLETGDFVRIMNGVVPRNRKPIGIHWLQAPFVAATDAVGLATENPIWPYRIPSLLGGIAAVLATHALALTLWADRRAALLAGGMLAGCVLLTVEAHIAKTDAALLGATTVAMAVLARVWMRQPLSRAGAAMFWLALGIGVLIKGPITPMVAGLTVLTLMLATGQRGWAAALRPWPGLVLVLAVTAPWFIAIGLATHGAFFHDAVGGDLGRKLAGGEESHGGPPGLHLLLLPLLVFPATLPVIAGLADAARRRGEPAIQFLLAWLIPGWLVFEAVPTKLPHYPLPLYPALMLLGAAWLRRPAVGGVWTAAGAGSLTGPGTRFLPVAKAALLGAGAFIGLAALALPVLVTGDVTLQSPGSGALHGLMSMFGLAATIAGHAITSHAALCLPACLAAALVVILAWRVRSGASLAASVLLYGAILHWELPALSALWIAPRVVGVLRAEWPGYTRLGTGLIAAGYAEPSLMFLAGTRIVLLARGEGGAQVLAATPHGAVLVERHVLPEFEAEAARLHVAMRRMGTIDGYNYSHGRDTALTLFTRAD